jgi:Peptidase family M1 domain
LRNKIFLLVSACILQLNLFSQNWQQQVSYNIDVSLNDKDHSLDGFEKIIYSNYSPDTLTYIWFHLWPNAYKNDKTAFSDQLLENGKTKFYFSPKEEKGYINRLDFRVDNIAVRIEDHPQHTDIVKLILPSPLAPNQTITITTPFHVQLPYNISRGGHVGQSYQCTQWYPKPAVYDHKGWHPMPYLDQGEFYSEFGNAEVKITVPSNYVVAASGYLVNEDERNWLMERKNFTWKPIKKKIKNSKGIVETRIQEFPESSPTTKTLHYKQILSHDFAWFADKRFIVNYEPLVFPSDKLVHVFSFYTPEHKTIWANSLQNAKDAVQFFSTHVGEYPYNTVSVVQGPASFGGGMEYPGITVISPMSSARELDKVIAHEVGHNWFYGILASNERMHPWMDEGINSFYESRYSQQKDRNYNQRTEQSFLETIIATKNDQPIETPSEKFSERNYGLIGYQKASLWVQLLEKEMGSEAFAKAMHEYFEKWKFKHPYPEDFKKVMEESSGKNLDSVFSLLTKTGSLTPDNKKGIVVQGIWKTAMQGSGNKKSAISFLPLPGYNSYDKIMAGLLFTNTMLPPSKFQFMAIPYYAFGSKEFNGIGFAFHTFYPKGIFKKIEPGISYSKFSQSKFESSDGNKAYLGFHKTVPGIRFTLRENDPRSTRMRFFQWKTFLIGEDALRFYRDTVVSPPNDTTIYNRFRTVNQNRTLNQLRIVIENYRALYPYSGELKLEQAKDFVRTAFTGNYFFNYPKGGGLNVRLFAGKFFYTGGKTITKQFNTDRYHLNMTGANGYEDYTYSDYFIGRNKFEGFESQQIMNRDGGFKVRTDLLASKVGKTDNWLSAINFSTTIPESVNPLSILPFKIPVKLFVDIGTFAEAWEKDAEIDRFLFDAGLQIPLMKETISIYIPLIYSKVFKDYIQSTIEKKGRFFKTISFTIDISNFNLRKFDRNLSF